MEQAAVALIGQHVEPSVRALRTSRGVFGGKGRITPHSKSVNASEPIITLPFDRSNPEPARMGIPFMRAWPGWGVQADHHSKCEAKSVEFLYTLTF